jgi:hypothetical protein
MRVIVCGGRDYEDRWSVYSALDELLKAEPLDTLMVIQGGASGADEFAREWCIKNRVEMVNVPANWEVHGKAAGPVRNQKMVSKYRPELVLAFPGGRGTADMVRRAEDAGIAVRHPASPSISSKGAVK